MNTFNNTNGGFYMAIAPNNSNQVLIFNGLHGCLKVLANSEKYFRSYEPEFFEFDFFGKKYKVTKKELKDSFMRQIDNGLKAGKISFTNAEIEELAYIFKIRLENTLSEKKRPKNYQTGSSNRARDKQRKALPPGKRVSKSGRTYTERRKNHSDARPKYRL